MCGIIAIYHPQKASQEVYEGLLTLQHRGQDAAGLFHYDPQCGEFHLSKGPGEVTTILGTKDWTSYPGAFALGHTRYATVGSGSESELQPHAFKEGDLLSCFAHNGNILNNYPLRSELKKQGYPFTSENDIEVIQRLFHYNFQKTKDLAQTVKAIFNKVVGGYAVVSIIPQMGLLAFRDPNGLRPLVLGRKNKSYILASESLALDFLGYEIERDIKPGEMVFIDLQGNLTSTEIIQNPVKKCCFFEWIYFASPESVLEKLPVYEARLRLGDLLAKEMIPMIDRGEIDPDLVAPVPDTGRVAGTSLAEKLSLPFREILIKNRYIKRSFILTPSSREKAIHFKYHPVKNQIKGKKILLVDDSIVRGSTSKHLIRLIRNAGAKEIYFVSTSPPIRHPCFYGLDFPHHQQLLAATHTHAQMEELLGVDKLIYLPEYLLTKALDQEHLCMACVNGHYPTALDSASEFQKARQ